MSVLDRQEKLKLPVVICKWLGGPEGKGEYEQNGLGLQKDPNFPRKIPNFQNTGKPESEVGGDKPYWAELSHKGWSLSSEASRYICKGRGLHMSMRLSLVERPENIPKWAWEKRLR